jgi:hypothetical protein
LGGGLIGIDEAKKNTKTQKHSENIHETFNNTGSADKNK